VVRLYSATHSHCPIFSHLRNFPIIRDTSSIIKEIIAHLLFLNWRASIRCTSPPKTGKESFDTGMSKHTSHDWNIPQTRRGNGEELPKQINQTINLHDHAHHGPSKKNQCHTAEEGDDAANAILARKKSHRTRCADGESEAREEENVTEGEEGGVEEEEDAEEEEGEAQEH